VSKVAGSGRTRRHGEPPQRVRIIGGAWRRTPIPVADSPDLRPTPDRVRETLFNWLAHLCADFSALRGLDLFAGSGALGFELASRGAVHVVLVERQPQLLRRLHALSEKLGATNTEIVAGEALAVAARLPRAAFDVVFLDPPFGSDLLWPAIAAARPLLTAAGMIYAETDRPIIPADAAARGLELLRAGRAGRVCFHLLRLRVA
jgi:16S rRNA (guanine(966)-N(2))-methyltransferase RsmD